MYKTLKRAVFNVIQPALDKVGGNAPQAERAEAKPAADAAGAAGGDGVDAGAVDVALHGLDEAGVDAAALLGLERDAGLLLGDDDAVDADYTMN